MSLRLGCDLDGTLADMETALQEKVTALFGPSANLRAGLNDEQIRGLWEDVRQTRNFWASLREIEPGAVARLAAVAQARRWEVIFLTQRPPSAGDVAQVQSQHWLRAHGFDLPSVYVVSASRGRIAEALELDVVLDDRQENCIDVVATSGARAVLLWREGAETAPAGAARVGIDVAFSIEEAVQRLEKIRPARGRGPGLMDRVRNALGI